MHPDLERRLGGPIGSHARRSGIWFDPAPWSVLAATLVWLATMLRHQPCQQQRAGQPVDAFLRLCYSDVPVLHQSGLGSGQSLYRQVEFTQPPLTGAFVDLARGLSRLLGAHVSTSATAQQVVDGARTFQAVTALLLYCCLLVVVGCVMLMGRGSEHRLATRPRHRFRSWDALLVAASPAVLTAGLVSWDLFTVSLVSAALLAWSLRRATLAGVLLGLATAAGTWPLLVLLSLWLLCRRAGRLDAWRRTAAPTVGVALLAALALLAWSPSGAVGIVTSWWRRGPDLGSVWFLVDQVHQVVPGVQHLALAPAGLGAIVLVLLAWWALRVARLVATAPRRPRVGQVAFLLVAGWLLVDKGYTPQQVLWLLPLVVLARPQLRDWAVWSTTETLYWWAVWAHLDGQTSANGFDGFYLAAIVVRLTGLLWLVGRVVQDVREPWQDPVRGPLVDDPAGGVLDHAPDTARAQGVTSPAGTQPLPA